jgi:L-asparagine oxygenase
VLLRFADDVGRAVGYDREQSGQLIQDIFPVKSSERAQVSSSSKVMLGSHTETAFHPHKPRYVVLMCLRGDPAAATTYADVDDVVTYLSDDDIAILQTDRFTTTVDPSFMANDYTFVYDELLMSGTTTRAAHALQSLHHAVRRATRQIVLDSGDLLVIDNDRAVHGRTPFAPRYDGTDRWLKRALVMTALPTTDIIGRVIQTAL